MTEEFEKARDEASYYHATEPDMRSSWRKSYKEGADWAYEWLSENYPIFRDYAEQRQKLAIAVEALEICAKSNPATDPTGIHFSTAQEALAKIRGEE